jgi:hypothetical protein
MARHKPPRFPAPSSATAVGFGYVGAWANGLPGWVMPTHVDTSYRPRKRRYPGRVQGQDWNIGEPSYLCRITVTPVLDKRGRLIVRRIKK